MLPTNGILPIIHKIHHPRKAACGQNALSFSGCKAVLYCFCKSAKERKHPWQIFSLAGQSKNFSFGSNAAYWPTALYSAAQQLGFGLRRFYTQHLPKKIVQKKCPCDIKCGTAQRKSVTTCVATLFLLVRVVGVEPTRLPWLRPLFRVFARGCMHAFGAHLPLEKCKKPPKGRGFFRIDRGRADDPFRYIGFSTV